MKYQIITAIKHCKSENELIELWELGIRNWSNQLSAGELQELIRTKNEKKFRLQHIEKMKRKVKGVPGNGDANLIVKECRACHQFKFWRIIGNNVWICSLCHPPVNPKGIEWLDLM